MILNAPRFQRIGDVAYRGLSGDAASPGSADATRRAYQHGIPALLDDRDGCSVAEILEIVGDEAFNPRRRPVYLSVSALPSLPLMAGFAPDADVYAIVRGSSNQAWDVWAWRDRQWQRTGAYVPATAPIDALALMTFEDGLLPLVIYEAPNVVAMPGSRSMIAELHEDQVQQAVRSYAGAGATIARVTDVYQPEHRPAAVRAA